MPDGSLPSSWSLLVRLLLLDPRLDVLLVELSAPVNVELLESAEDDLDVVAADLVLAHEHRERKVAARAVATLGVAQLEIDEGRLQVLELVSVEFSAVLVEDQSLLVLAATLEGQRREGTERACEQDGAEEGVARDEALLERGLRVVVSVSHLRQTGTRRRARTEGSAVGPARGRGDVETGTWGGAWG